MSAKDRVNFSQHPAGQRAEQSIQGILLLNTTLHHVQGQGKGTLLLTRRGEEQP